MRNVRLFRALLGVDQRTPGHDKATLRRFFDALDAERAAQITHVSADAAD